MSKKKTQFPIMSPAWQHFDKDGVQSPVAGTDWIKFRNTVQPESAKSDVGNESDLDIISGKTEDEEKIKLYSFNKETQKHEFHEYTPEELKKIKLKAEAEARKKAQGNKGNPPKKIAEQKKITKDSKGRDKQLLDPSKGSKGQYLWEFDGIKYPSGLTLKDFAEFDAKAAKIEGVSGSDLYLEAKNAKIREINSGGVKPIETKSTYKPKSKNKK